MDGQRDFQHKLGFTAINDKFKIASVKAKIGENVQDKREACTHTLGSFLLNFQKKTFL